MKNGTVGVTVANLSIADTPAQEHEFHWVWSVIGHPVIQAAVTEAGSVADVDWPAILGMQTTAGDFILHDDGYDNPKSKTNSVILFF